MKKININPQNRIASRVIHRQNEFVLTRIGRVKSFLNSILTDLSQRRFDSVGASEKRKSLNNQALAISKMDFDGDEFAQLEVFDPRSALVLKTYSPVLQKMDSFFESLANGGQKTINGFKMSSVVQAVICKYLTPFDAAVLTGSTSSAPYDLYRSVGSEPMTRSQFNYLAKSNALWMLAQAGQRLGDCCLVKLRVIALTLEMFPDSDDRLKVLEKTAKSDFFDSVNPEDDLREVLNSLAKNEG